MTTGELWLCIGYSAGILTPVIASIYDAVFRRPTKTEVYNDLQRGMENAFKHNEEKSEWTCD